MSMVEKRKRIFNSYYTFDKMKKEFKPTDKKIMAKVTGRDCTEYHVLNKPHFEDATISLKRKGLFWLNAIVKGEFRRF